MSKEEIEKRNAVSLSVVSNPFYFLNNFLI